MVPYGPEARVPGFHSGGLGSTPSMKTLSSSLLKFNTFLSTMSQVSASSCFAVRVTVLRLPDIWSIVSRTLRVAAATLG